MGKLYDSLQKQLKTEHKKDAEDCIKIYDRLKELSNGRVWESQWVTLVTTHWDGTYPNSVRRSSPSSLGKTFLDGLEETRNKHYLCIDFEQQGHPTKYKVGDIITFITSKGLIKAGIIKEIILIKGTEYIPSKYKVDCGGKLFTAVSDYVIKSDSRVTNVKSIIKESDSGFPLRT